MESNWTRLQHANGTACWKLASWEEPATGNNAHCSTVSFPNPLPMVLLAQQFCSFSPGTRQAGDNVLWSLEPLHLSGTAGSRQTPPPHHARHYQTTSTHINRNIFLITIIVTPNENCRVVSERVCMYVYVCMYMLCCVCVKFSDYIPLMSKTHTCRKTERDSHVKTLIAVGKSA